MARGTRATAVLDRAGVAYALHPYDYAGDVESKGEAAARALGIAPARVFKTLMTKVDQQVVCAVIPSDQRLSLKRLAAACAGKHAQMLDVAEAERRSGYRIGGISPFGQARPAPAVFASAAQAFEKIHLNAGQRGLLLEIAPADAITLLAARYADICD
ncbi:MAG: Cys-tRNA(Pro) deacylase [Stenotrophomonas sp.]